VQVLRWGEVGRLFRLLSEYGCRDAVLIGAISRRPDFREILPDLGAVRLMPRILRIIQGGDDSLLKGVAILLEERGTKLVSPLDIAPELGLPEGLVSGRLPRPPGSNMRKALDAARLIGNLDIGQAAVAVGDRVVALEDAGGTDGLLERVVTLRAAGRIAANGGVLVKCMKPRQDPRLDIPTVGPTTAEAALRAGLDGVVGEAGRTLLAGRETTIEAFARSGLFLLGVPASSDFA
jgi:DUF1009 family protein